MLICGTELVNIGIRVINVSNVIVRGLTIQKVIAPTDAIGESLEWPWCAGSAAN